MTINANSPSKGKIDGSFIAKATDVALAKR